MKQYFLLLIFAYLLLSQTSIFGTTFGGNHTFFHGDASQHFSENNEFVMGVEYSVHLRSKFQYRLVFMYDRFSFESKDATENQVFSKNVKLSYVSFSPHLIYLINQNTAFFLGPNIKYNITAKEIIDFTVAQASSNIDVTEFLYGISTGIGYRFKINSFSLEPRITYEKIFNNVLKEGDFSSEMSNILISVTLSFR